MKSLLSVWQGPGRLFSHFLHWLRKKGSFRFCWTEFKPGKCVKWRWKHNQIDQNITCTEICYILRMTSVPIQHAYKIYKIPQSSQTKNKKTNSKIRSLTKFGGAITGTKSNVRPCRLCTHNRHVSMTSWLKLKCHAINSNVYLAPKHYKLCHSWSLWRSPMWDKGCLVPNTTSHAKSETTRI